MAADEANKRHSSEPEKYLESLEINLPPNLEFNVEYPFPDSNRFNPTPRWGVLDVIHIEEDQVSGFAVGQHTSELEKLMNDVSAARAYLQDDGYKHDYYALLLDDTVQSFKEVVQELPPYFPLEALEDKWDDSERWKDFYDARILGDLRKFPGGGRKEDDGPVLPKHDHSMLEEQGLIYVEDKRYYTNEEMDVIRANNQPVLHVTPRIDVVYHPSELP